MKSFFKKIGNFFKRNAYYVILFVCIAGIAAMITLAAINGTQDNGNIIDNGNNNGGNNGGNNDDDDDDVSGGPILFHAPVGTFELGMDFSGDQFSYYLTLREWRTHKGVDFMAAADSEVYAAYDGVVQSVTTDVLSGTKIIIKHNDDLSTIYKSLASNVKVKAGDRVLKGDIIGYVSDSMNIEFKEGPHLHFEVMYKNALVDPMGYLDIGDK